MKSSFNKVNPDIVISEFVCDYNGILKGFGEIFPRNSYSPRQKRFFGSRDDLLRSPTMAQGDILYIFSLSNVDELELKEVIFSGNKLVDSQFMLPPLFFKKKRANTFELANPICIKRCGKG